MRKTIIILILFALVCCSGKKEQNPANTGSLENPAVVSNEKFLTDTVLNEGNTQYTILNEREAQYENDSSLIVQEEANVYVLPSIKSRIKGKVKTNSNERILGFAEKEGEAGGQTEYWVKIYCYEPGGAQCGWIQSKVTNKENISVSDLRIESSGKEERNGHIFYILRGENQEGEVFIEAQKIDKQNIYTFWWDHHTKGFHYTNRPGFYIWNEDKKELKHITYISGIEGEEETYGGSIWATVTDDYKYLIQDYGTGPIQRGFLVWNLDNGEIILSGIYYENININGHTIEFVKEYDEYHGGRWFNLDSLREGLTKEEIDFAKKFIETNKPPDDLVKTANSGGNPFALFLVVEYNMDNGETKIKGGEYFGVQ